MSFADLATGDLEALLLGSLPAAVRRLEASLVLLARARPAVVLLALDGRDERRSLLPACAAAGAAAVVVRPERAGDVDRADGGPQPAAVCDWEPGRDPGPVVDALRNAARGRVGAG